MRSSKKIFTTVCKITTTAAAPHRTRMHVVRAFGCPATSYSVHHSGTVAQESTQRKDQAYSAIAQHLRCPLHSLLLPSRFPVASLIILSLRPCCLKTHSSPTNPYHCCTTPTSAAGATGIQYYCRIAVPHHRQSHTRNTIKLSP